MMHMTGHGRVAFILSMALIVIGLVSLVVQCGPLQAWRRRSRLGGLGVERG